MNSLVNRKVIFVGREQSGEEDAHLSYFQKKNTFQKEINYKLFVHDKQCFFLCA